MKGKELYTKAHAELIMKGSIGRSYRPSNGTEGSMFMDRFCYQCTKDNFDEKTFTGGCDIIVLTMGYDTDDSEYPKEWVYDEDGQPICTAFDQKEGDHGN